MEEKHHTSILNHYKGGLEKSRLFSGAGQMEFFRTKSVIKRFVPEPPAVVFDVGGGPGEYAFWFAGQGYQTHLVDIVPLHVEMAEEQSKLSDSPLKSIEVGDARCLSAEPNTADVVLLLGPLYHLQDKGDRLKALSEANRILKPGGLLFAACISKFASAFDGMFRNLIADPDFMEIVKEDLKSGRHLNVDENPEYFTTAYFHHPDELVEEIAEVGFNVEAQIGLEGPSWLMQDFEHHWDDKDRRGKLIEIIELLETEGALMGVSAHILGVGRKS